MATVSISNISNAAALYQLTRELGVSTVDIFLAAGRKTSPTYSRESAIAAHKKYEDEGGHVLPQTVLNYCYEHQLFPSGSN